MTTKGGVSKPFYKLLEEEYANFTGSKYAVVVNTGTAALHLCLVALGIGQEDEVILPDFTMAACGFAVSYCGARPVFVDCDSTLNIDVTKIEEKITSKTKAIMAVHIYGRLCNMKEIHRIAKKHNLFVIEDACEAQGAVFKSKAKVSCYSLYKNKIIHAEEGGIITTNDKQLHDKMQYLKNMAFDEGHTYFHKDIGFNYRLAESQAKMALKSLKQANKNIKKRQQIASWFDEFLVKDIQMPKRDVVWVYDVMDGDSEDWIKQPWARRFFKPLSSMPMWKQKIGKNSQYFSKNGAYIIINPSMTKSEVKKICQIIQNI